MFKKISFICSLSLFFIGILPAQAATTWKPQTPDGYTPITWVSARGVASFVKSPTGNGYADFLTSIYLPYSQIKFLSSSTTPPISWGPAQPPFDLLNIAGTTTDTIQDWAVPRIVADQTKSDNPDVKFLWNVPFFNITADTTDLSLSLKLTNAFGTFISSGSRPAGDIAQPRRMLIINNTKGTAEISDFDEEVFASASSGDQAVEGFAPTVVKSDGAGVATARLFLGVKPNNKELVVYCSRGASSAEASDALLDAGVPVENQMMADGGGSATCGYNLPGQYFVEPGRTLPYLMGSVPLLYRGVSTIKDLNVRKGPGAKNAVVRKLTKNAPVMIFELKSGWYRIGANEWVSASLIKKS